jgi:hypothetical protein
LISNGNPTVLIASQQDASGQSDLVGKVALMIKYHVKNQQFLKASMGSLANQINKDSSGN